ATTRIVRTDHATIADPKPGLFVAVTARQQPDNSLLASIRTSFPASLAANVPAGQRPLPQGDLMTNASIASVDQVSGSSFTVSFLGRQREGRPRTGRDRHEADRRESAGHRAGHEDRCAA